MKNMTVTTNTERLEICEEKQSIAFYSIVNQLSKSGYENTFIMLNKPITAILINHEEKEFSYDYGFTDGCKSGIDLRKII